MVVTADDRPGVVERVFTAGADDFVTIPDRRAELPHRLVALRRRSSGIWTSTSSDIGPDVKAVLSTAAAEDTGDPPSTRGVVLMDGRRIVFTDRELSILAYLKSRYRMWVKAAELLTIVCDCPQQRDSTLVRVHISAIRRKLGAYGNLIESRRTYGYRWVGAPDER
jgi:DNA-binding response OmpR family regulator